MSQSNAGQRKMMRRMTPKRDGVFNAPLVPHSDRPQSSLSARRVRRAAKKQIATQENRAARREEL